MKIGIATGEGDHNFSPSFEYPPTEAVVYNTDLPNEVTRSLALLDQEFSLNGSIPVFNQLNQGHGNDYGLVFRVGYHDQLTFLPEDTHASFSKIGLIARISMGMPNTTQSIHGEHVKLKDSTQLSRLHLNVYAARNFLPPEEQRSEEADSFRYASEQIHFSMRWVDGQFDTVWNDPAAWIREKDSRDYVKPRFHSMRTTYFETRESNEALNGKFYGGDSDDPRKPKGAEIGIDDVERMIGTERKRVLPANLSSDEFMESFPDGTSSDNAQELSGYRGNHNLQDGFRHIGYAPALGILSQYGDVSSADSTRILEMNMADGVEYIFGKVLPAMRKFSQA